MAQAPAERSHPWLQNFVAFIIVTAAIFLIMQFGVLAFGVISLIALAAFMLDNRKLHSPPAESQATEYSYVSRPANPAIPATPAKRHTAA